MQKGVMMTHPTILTHFCRSAVVSVVAVAPKQPLGPLVSRSFQLTVEFIEGHLMQRLFSFSAPVPGDLRSQPRGHD